MKIFAIIIGLFVPLVANAKTCADYDRDVGSEIRNVFGMMHELYMANILPHIVMDEVMTELHLTFNEEYMTLFNVAARDNPESCKDIAAHGIAWVNTYKVRILDEFKLSKRNG